MNKCLAQSIGYPFESELADAMKIGLRNQRQEVTYMEAAKTKRRISTGEKHLAEEMKRPDYNLRKTGKLRPAASTATSRRRRVTSR
jgi:hypothetical protein